MELEQPSVDRRFERVAEEANEPIDPQCNCDHDCPGVSPCICIAIYENEHGTCQCWCSGGVTEDRRYGLEQKVDLSARAAPLSRIGLVLASKCTADVFVPALDFDKPVTLWLKGVTLGAAIRETGLVTRDRED
jgi:hypothetical protein